jgi:hypothetical protein
VLHPPKKAAPGLFFRRNTPRDEPPNPSRKSCTQCSRITLFGKEDIAMPKLSHSVSGAVRLFSFWVANRSVGHPLLEGIDYSCIFEEPSALEQVYAIFMNVLEVDGEGSVTNAAHAQKRAAQYMSRPMYLFFSVVGVILGCVLAYYTFIGLRTEQFTLSARFGGPRPVVSKAGAPTAYWIHVAVIGSTTLLAWIMSVFAAKTYRAGHRKNA